MKYQFTDTELAAERLKYLAEVFAGSSQSFIRNAVHHPPRLALDLGCGPGYTTHLLSDCTNGHRTVGLDNSAYFIDLALQTRNDRVSFSHHDVTSFPFPTEPAGLIYCRYLLTHLKSPHKRLDKWATQLVSGGLLLVEENEWIRTTHEVFTTYLSIVEALLNSQSTQLYLGPELNRLSCTENLIRKSSCVTRLTSRTHQAATLFYMNIQSWKHQPFIRETYPEKAISELENRLKDLAETETKKSDIEWSLRQIVFEKRK